MSRVVDLIQIRVVATLRQQLPNGQSVHGASDLVDDLALDALGVKNLVLLLEDRFDVSMPLALTAKIATVDDLADVLKTCLYRNHTAAAA